MDDQLDADPTLRDWLNVQLREAGGASSTLPPLTSMALLAGSRPGIEMPPAVFRAWQRLIVRQRRMVDQSEEAFISRARKQGMSWAEVAKELGYGSGKEVAAQHASLVERLVASHPEVSAEPWSDQS